MAEKQYKLGQIATQTEIVFVNEKDEKEVLSQNEVLLRILNNTEKLVEAMTK